MKISSAILSFIAIISTCAQAAEPVVEPAQDEEKIAEVAVNGVRNPELKPYRVMSAGLDAFDEHRQLAPNATLKFKLQKRGDYAKKTSWDAVSLRIAGTDSSIPVPIAADGTFTLPRSKEAYDDEADLVLNQKKSLISFGVEVRTPGVPDYALRVGDLRLRCQVIMAIGKKELNFAIRAAFTTAFRTTDWCSAPRAQFGIGLPDWSINTNVVYGGTRKALPPNGYHITGPIQDKSVPDDALVEFEYWGGASAERKQQFLEQWPLYLKSSVNKWGAGPQLRLTENGIYRAVLPLKQGSWKFNLESQGREINIGVGPGSAATVFNVDQPLQWHGNALTMNVEQAGSYEFSLNLHDPDHPVVTVKRL